MVKFFKTLFILTIICASSECNNCDVTKFKVIENIDFLSLLKHGERWTLLRYRNGYDRKTVCQNNKITLMLPNKTVLLINQSFWPNGTSTLTEPTAVVVDPLTRSGKVVLISWDPVIVFYIVYADENLIFFSSCLDGEEYLYVDCIEQYPSEEVWETINKVIRKLKLDKSKITRMCVGDFPMF